MRPESATTGRTLSWFSVAALALVPLLAFTVLIGLVNRPSSDTVSAAIVNLDEPVTVQGQYVPMGRQLAAAIVDESDKNITWTLANQETAREGLRTGEYSVVVTVPANFSAAATSFAGNDAATANQATIDLQVAQNSPITDAQLGEQIARIATGTINSSLTETYLDNVFIGLNTVGDQLGQITDAAGQLQDGSSQLASGASEAASGAGELADGLGQLADGAPQLASGGQQISSGTGDLADGASQLADGAQQLNTGVGQLAAQAPQLVDGVGQLADGADQLLGAIPSFASGSKEVVLGVGQLATGLDQAVQQISNEQTTAQLQALTAGAQGVATGAAGVSGGLSTVNQTLGGLASGNAQAQGAASQIAAGVAGAFQCPVSDPTTCALLEQTFAAGANAAALEGFKAGAGAGVQALNTPEQGVTLLGAAAAVSDGAAQLSAGVGLIPGQFEGLAAGLGQLATGANQIVTSAQPIVDNADTLGTGATTLLTGINELNGQVGELPAGVNQLADGVNQLASGASQLSVGTEQLSSGVSQYVSGVDQFADGTTQAAAGAPILVDGLAQLADGASQLDEGIGTFGEQIAAGAADAPSYSEADRATLSQVVANPVQTPAGPAGFNSTATVSLLMVAGLWLASMLAFVMVRPVPASVVASKASSLALWTRTVGMPGLVVALQGVVFGVIGGTILGLGIGSTVLLSVVLAALGVSFVLANHALTAWLGNWGRGIAVLLLGATVAVAVSSVGTGWLGWLDAVSPLQNAFLLVRTQAADGGGSVGLLGGAVLLGAIALGTSVLAITTRRSLSAAKYRRRVAG